MTHYFDAALIEKYRMTGPRYTSYPTAVQFHEHFGEQDYLAQLQESNQHKKDLSLYIHIPFCTHVCYYCACNKIITQKREHAAAYLDYLRRDIERQSAHIDASRKVVQLHLGGGTPTFLTPEQQSDLMAFLRDHFTFAAAEESELSIEIDPRTVDKAYLAHLRQLGFNRLSFGIQDTQEAVQKAVNRVQPLEEIAQLMNEARALAYQSLSVDLIYGLPLQTPARFAKTLEDVVRLNPDRLAVYNYAHMPTLFGAQKQINADDLPDSHSKLAILETTINQLTGAGYEFIGLDHFAKPEDTLVTHQKNGTLYRNFQGYSTFSQCDLLGFGISAISQVHHCYSQHEKSRQNYYQALDEQRLPVMRGIMLTLDDRMRRDAIMQIMCNLRLDLAQLSIHYQRDAQKYFAPEWQQLTTFADDALIELTAETLIVLPVGRLFIRNIAMVFDRYLSPQNPHRFSQVI